MYCYAHHIAVPLYQVPATQPRATSLSFPAKMREIKKALELDPALGIPSTIKAGFELMGEAVPP
eukprot:COSAG05_NODE_3924_length_1772_cov_69.567244_1_plen_63_part_10